MDWSHWTHTSTPTPLGSRVTATPRSPLLSHLSQAPAGLGLDLTPVAPVLDNAWYTAGAQEVFWGAQAGDNKCF